jgi:predicted dehydrogenase
MRKVRWGQLSTAKIGLKKVLPAMMRSEHCEVVAISSRELETAREAARSLNIAKAYGSYEELLADPEIDAIYNPLPNHLHVPWSIRALEAGKHVLCEKPIGMSASEAQTLLVAARQRPHLKVMEAFMYRHHPQWQRAKRLVEEGAFGELRTVQSFFSYYLVDPANVRNRADIGGGGLMDIGCYGVSLARFLFDAEPRRVMAISDIDPALKIDRLTSGILDFGSGTSIFTCATQLAGFQRVDIVGTTGRAEIDIPFNAPPDRPVTMRYVSGTNVEEIALPVVDQYTRQGDAMSLAILKDAPVPTPLEDAVANMRVIDALVASVRRNEWMLV